MRAFSNPNMDLKILHIKLATLSVHTVEHPSITDTIGDQNFVRYSEVSLTQGLLVYFR